MALQLEFSLNSRDHALLEDAVASLRAIAGVAPTLEKIMAAIDDLNTNLEKFSTDFSSLASDISSAIAALQSGVSSGNDAAIQAAADRLASLDAQLADADAKLKAALPTGAPPSPSASRSSGGGASIA